MYRLACLTLSQLAWGFALLRNGLGKNNILFVAIATIFEVIPFCVGIELIKLLSVVWSSQLFFPYTELKVQVFKQQDKMLAFA